MASLALLALAACGDASAGAMQKQERPTTAVRVSRVVFADEARQVIGVGRLASASDVRLGFKTGGVVAAIAVDVGDVVRKGQVIARLDPREIDAAVKQAESGLGKAERDLERASKLRSDHVVPGEVLENATTARDLARAGVQAARFNRGTAVLRAPEDGVVLARLGEPGEVVGPGQPVLLIGARQDGLVARVGVPERDAGQLAPGDRALVTVDGQAPVTARVTRVAPAISPRTATVELELTFDSPQGGTVGALTRAVITPARREALARLPMSALVDGQGLAASVWVVAGEKAEKRPVTIAWLSDDGALVKSGLRAGELVVTDGAPYLDDGSSLEVIP